MVVTLPDELVVKVIRAIDDMGNEAPLALKRLWAHLDFIVCPVCGVTSHNPNHIREGYCGFCHDYTQLPRGNVMTNGSHRAAQSRAQRAGMWVALAAALIALAAIIIWLWEFW